MRLDQNFFFARASAILVITVLTGCASLQDLRDKQPNRTDLFEGTSERLAKCVANTIDEVYSDRSPILRVDDAGQKARIFFLIQPSGTPMYDISFTQVSTNKVRVEGRGMTTIYGSDHMLKDLWPLLPKCEAKLRLQKGAR